MILQEVLTDVDDQTDLYFRIEGSSQRDGNTIVLMQNAIFSTDTYYGSFSVGKWMKYCNVGELWLNVTIQGKAEVVVVHSLLNEEKQLEGQVIASRKIFALTTKEEIAIALPEIFEGTVFFSIKSLSEHTFFFGAKYMADCKKKKEINLALNICTFHREEILLRNIELLKSSFIENIESPLNGHLTIFITDNGKSLDRDKLKTSNIHVVYNQNVGGAGGFSRGLLEISKRKEEEGITNVIFMDDDIEVIPEALIRTFRILSILKEEYEDAFLAGAMLRQDYNYIQYENAACWNGGKCEFINRGLDLRAYRNVVFNELERGSEYGAWWYCCVPSDIITQDNLAVPLFIHLDDVEYSLRNTSQIITLNGIAVIHPVSEQRVVSSNIYYDLRNMLIVNAKYYPDFEKKEIKKILWQQMMNAYLRYRYRDIRLLYKAVEDFHKGPDWLVRLDAAAYHQLILKDGYRFEDVTAMLNQGIPTFVQQKNPVVDYFGSKKGRWTAKKIVKLVFMVITLNGAYLPTKPLQAFDMNVTPSRLFRHSKIILFDEMTMQGITLKRDVMKIIELVGLYCKACRMLDKRYDSCREQFETAWHNLHSLSYWGKVIQ